MSCPMIDSRSTPSNRNKLWEAIRTFSGVPSLLGRRCPELDLDAGCSAAAVDAGVGAGTASQELDPGTSATQGAGAGAGTSAEPDAVAGAGAFRSTIALRSFKTSVRSNVSASSRFLYHLTNLLKLACNSAV